MFTGPLSALLPPVSAQPAPAAPEDSLGSGPGVLLPAPPSLAQPSPQDKTLCLSLHHEMPADLWPGRPLRRESSRALPKELSLHRGGICLLLPHPLGGCPRWPRGSAGQQSGAPAGPESRLGWLGPSLCLCPPLSVCLSLSPNTAMTAPIAHMVSCQDLTLFRTFRSCLEPAVLGVDPVGQAVKLILTRGHVSLAVASRGRM